MKIDAPFLTCPACFGSGIGGFGQDHLHCDTCNGTGRIIFSERKHWYKIPKWVAVLSGIVAAAGIVYVLLVLWFSL